MIRLAFFLTVFPVLSESRRNGTCDICDCSANGRVDCSNRNLNSIPRDLNTNTTSLNMSSNYLQGIEDGIFENLTNLKILDLYNTSLKSDYISGTAFAGLDSLVVLNISQNDQLPLTNVSTPDELFEHIPYLEVLSMYGTTGTYSKSHGYPDVQLCKLRYLKELWTDGLTDMEFGPEFRNMSSLKTLHLAGDFIEPSWRSKEFCNTNLRNGMLDNLVSITHLYIRKCGVLSVDRSAFQKLDNLEYLDLSKNRELNITQLFESFCSLSNKTTSLILNNIVPILRSPNNCGYTITESMVKCLKSKSVRELQLNHNRLQYIETTALKSLPKTLQIVSAAKNEFYLGLYIFDVSYMTNLTELDISYQFFTDDTSIWHGHTGQKELLETVSGTVNGNEPNNSNVSEMKWNKGNRNSHEDQIAEERFQSGSEFQGFVEQLFTSILYTETFHYKPHQSGNNSYEPVCPQLNIYIPPGTIIANIPPNLASLDISHSKHASPVFQLFVNESNNLRKLKASNSLLYCWEGPVHGLNKLEYLDLSVNFCTKMSNRFFHKVSGLKFLNISFNFLSGCIANDDQGQIFSHLTALEYLDISANKILAIPKLFLKAQSKLKKFYAQGNLLEKFDVDIRHMTQLLRIDLRMNKIGWLSENICEDLERAALLTSSNTNRSLFVDLRNNSIQCSCKNLKFIKWVYEHFQRVNASLLVNISYCISYEDWETKIFESRESLGDMVANLELQCRSYTVLIAVLSVTLALIINVILGVLVHRFRWKLQYWYYVVLDNRCIKNVREGGYEPVDEPRYKYDVFVASSDDRKEFVIDKLRPVFGDMGLAAFIPVYHIYFNEPLVSIIGKAINESRVILFVFSKEWSSDHSMNIAVHMWQCDMIKRKRQTVLGIYLNNMRGTDAEKVEEVYCQAFIDYPGDTDQDEEMAFWRECVRRVRDLGDAD